MQIVRDLGGYTMGRSDLVRRAMSKKKQSVMEKERLFLLSLVTRSSICAYTLMNCFLVPPRLSSAPDLIRFLPWTRRRDLRR